MHETTVGIVLGSEDEDKIGKFHVHVSALSGDLSCSTADGHYDPLGVLQPTKPSWYGTQGPFSFEVGDLSGKYGLMTELSPFALIPFETTDGNLPLFGIYSILGRSIVMHDAVTADRYDCSNLGDAPIAVNHATWNKLCNEFVCVANDGTYTWTDGMGPGAHHYHPKPYPRHAQKDPVDPVEYPDYLCDHDYLGGGSAGSTDVLTLAYQTIMWVDGDVSYCAPMIPDNGVYMYGENEYGSFFFDVNNYYALWNNHHHGGMPVSADECEYWGYSPVEHLNPHGGGGKFGSNDFSRSEMNFVPKCVKLGGKLVSLSFSYGTNVVSEEATRADGPQSIKVFFKQLTPFHPTEVKYEVNDPTFSIGKHHVHQHWYATSGDCMSAGGHYDPLNALDLGVGYGVGNQWTYEVGDMSGKFGKMQDWFVADGGVGTFEAIDYNLPLWGMHTVEGRSMVFHGIESNAPRRSCTRFGLRGTDENSSSLGNYDAQCYGTDPAAILQCVFQATGTSGGGGRRKRDTSDDLASHGCWCPKVTLGTSIGGTPETDLDRICRDWSKCENCRSKDASCEASATESIRVFLDTDNADYECLGGNRCNKNWCECLATLAADIVEYASNGGAIDAVDCTSGGAAGGGTPKDACCGNDPATWQLYSTADHTCDAGDLN